MSAESGRAEEAGPSSGRAKFIKGKSNKYSIHFQIPNSKYLVYLHPPEIDILYFLENIPNISKSNHVRYSYSRWNKRAPASQSDLLQEPLPHASWPFLCSCTCSERRHLPTKKFDPSDVL